MEAQRQNESLRRLGVTVLGFVFGIGGATAISFFAYIHAMNARKEDLAREDMKMKAEAALREKTLAREEARFNEEMQIRKEALAKQEAQFEAEMQLREAQLKKEEARFEAELSLGREFLAKREAIDRETIKDAIKETKEKLFVSSYRNGAVEVSNLSLFEVYVERVSWTLPVRDPFQRNYEFIFAEPVEIKPGHKEWFEYPLENYGGLLESLEYKVHIFTTRGTIYSENLEVL